MVGNKRKTKVKKQKTGRFGHYISRSNKLRFMRTPGGKTVTYFKGKKTSKAECADCGASLNVVARKRSMKKPSRPYGGNLCSRCMRIRLIARTRK